MRGLVPRIIELEASWSRSWVINTLEWRLDAQIGPATYAIKKKGNYLDF